MVFPLKSEKEKEVKLWIKGNKISRSSTCGGKCSRDQQPSEYRHPQRELVVDQGWGCNNTNPIRHLIYGCEGGKLGEGRLQGYKPYHDGGVESIEAL